MRRSFARRTEASGWLVALVCACGPTPGSTESATRGETGTTGGSSGSTATPSTGGSGSTATPTTGEPGPFCVDPQPIFQRGGEVPSGFERCANGVVHRVEAVACAVEGVGDCSLGGTECHVDSDCVEAPHGTCHEMSILGCGCMYGCGSDTDCKDGEICACAGVIGNISQCVPAGCVDDGDCAPGLCALASGHGACGGDEGQTACIDADSACLVHDECPEIPDFPGCRACWPEAGAWACGSVPGCGAVC